MGAGEWVGVICTAYGVNAEKIPRADRCGSLHRQLPRQFVLDELSCINYRNKKRL